MVPQASQTAKKYQKVAKRLPKLGFEEKEKILNCCFITI
jgi:hypothetical protein